ncbi:MAG: helix-turn-helix domain-containing protein [Thermodesulfobacteriota bacterium]
MLHINNAFNWKDYINKSWMGKAITPAQSEILCLLSVHADRYVSMDDIISFLYPDPFDEPDFPQACVRQFIVQIRKKFGRYIIICDWQRGYRINTGNYRHSKRVKVNRFLQTDGFST